MQQQSDRNEALSRLLKIIGLFCRMAKETDFHTRCTVFHTRSTHRHRHTNAHTLTAAAAQDDQIGLVKTIFD